MIYIQKYTFHQISIREAGEFTSKYHHSHRPVKFCRFAIGLYKYKKLIGIATAGRPVSYNTDQQEVLEISRIATDGTKNSSSLLLSRITRIARLFGYKYLSAYVLAHQEAYGLRAAGFHFSGYTRRNYRKNKSPEVNFPGKKKRYLKKL